MIEIHSLLPNPVGPDAGAEWIRLVNHSEDTVNLEGWTVKDLSGKVFSLSGALPRGEQIILRNSETKIALNNDRDTIVLYSPAGAVVDKLSYENPSEGEVVVAGGEGESLRAPAAGAASGAAIQNAIPPSTFDFSPLLLGLALALVAGVIAGWAAKSLNAK